MWANLQYYAELAKDSWRAANWGDKLRVWFKHPGWRPADVAAAWPKPAFEIAKVERFDPPMSRAAMWFAGAMFLAMLVATTAFLWNAHRMTLPQQALFAAGIVAGLWLIGLVSERPLRAAAQEPSPQA